ncbi:MAG: class I SAM-dependent methyltransferase [Candidatus Promineifilaceae bacterium]|nr:class I SAM-dependent methyltransferase [Candidatus Promineifilaceae bacterium]
MTIFHWIEENLAPAVVSSPAFIYDDMASQSGRSLPVVYQPFDAHARSHWRDRGALFDYLAATRGVGARLLDFGPGDGWPSLTVAPFARDVVGVDASWRRVAVCTANAARLGIENARFVQIGATPRLPFADASFDGAMAASSLEQSVEPKLALRELARVLRPGGRLRIGYESLERYRGEAEQDLWLQAIDTDRCRLILFDRYPEREMARQYGLTLALPAEAVRDHLAPPGERLAWSDVDVAALDELREALLDARVCFTRHPTAHTWMAWLREAGFREVLATHSGSAAGGMLFDALPAEERPQTQAAVEAYLRPIVETVVEMAAPVVGEPMITAVR